MPSSSSSSKSLSGKEEFLYKFFNYHPSLLDEFKNKLNLQPMYSGGWNMPSHVVQSEFSVQSGEYEHNHSHALPAHTHGVPAQHNMENIFTELCEMMEMKFRILIDEFWDKREYEQNIKALSDEIRELEKKNEFLKEEDIEVT